VTNCRAERAPLPAWQHDHRHFPSGLALSDSGKAHPASGQLPSPIWLTPRLDVALFPHLSTAATLARDLALTSISQSPEVYGEAALKRGSKIDD
jgi:hypothetical protein